MKKLLPLLVTVIALSVSYPAIAQAANETLALTPNASPASTLVSLVVSPPSYTLDAKPGDTLQETVKVTNSSTQDVNLTAVVNDYIVQDDMGTPIRVTAAASGRYLASPWFTLDHSSITLKPGATDQVVAIISVPADALPGGHYAGVFFVDNPAHTGGKTASYTAAEVGSLFKITVAGNITYNALIKNFTVNGQLFEFGPVNFATSIENQSDTQISPKADIAIYDMIGRKLTDVKLPSVNIFPFASRNLTGTWNTVWGLGRYTATLTASYGPNGNVATRTLQFWIVPYRLVAAALVVIMVAIAIFILIRRHIEHRLDKRDGEIDQLKRRIVELENQR